MDKDGKKSGGRTKHTPNKVTQSMQELAKPFAKRALKVVVKLLKSSNEAIRLKAGTELLDRGYGKAQQVTEVKGTQVVQLEYTDTELARRAAYILTKADMDSEQSENIVH